MTEVKVKKQRLAKNPELIFKAASGLSLISKIALRDQLSEEITANVKSLKEAADHAEKLSNGSK